MNTTTRIPIVLMSVEETAQAVSISAKTVRYLIRPRQAQSRKFRYSYDKNLFARPPWRKQHRQ